MKRRLFATPIVLASEDLGASRSTPLAGPDDLLGMRAAIAGGDVAAARAAGARFSSMASSYSPGAVGPDRLLAYATMLLTLGDTVGATRQLETALDGIPRARSILLDATPQAAVLGRVLLLRAQLAVRAGDRTTAIRRLGEVEALWRGADAELRTPIDMLRRQL
jgi:hypothetical protein